MNTVVLSGTHVSFCYTGARLLSNRLVQLGLRGVFASDVCNQEVERQVGHVPFGHCASDSLLAVDEFRINATLCMSAQQSVSFPVEGLTCPLWSTWATGGAAVIAADAVSRTAALRPRLPG